MGHGHGWIRRTYCPAKTGPVRSEKAIRRADIVLVCLSKQSVDRTGYVQSEIKYALDVADEQAEGTIFIIPALLEDCQIPDRLSSLHYVRLFEATGYPLLLRALQARAGPAPTGH